MFNLFLSKEEREIKRLKKAIKLKHGKEVSDRSLLSVYSNKDFRRKYDEKNDINALNFILSNDFYSFETTHTSSSSYCSCSSTTTYSSYDSCSTSSSD